MRILGAVFAGGRSSRFGSDKALAHWRGQSLIRHSWDALDRVSDARVICGRSYDAMPWIPDWPAPDLGPLGGLCAALRHASANGFDRVVTIGCDTPMVPPALIEALATEPDAVYVERMPVLGGWPTTLSDRLEYFMAHDARRAVRDWAATADARPIASPPLSNVNAPADLERLSRAD